MGERPGLVGEAGASRRTMSVATLSSGSTASSSDSASAASLCNWNRKGRGKGKTEFAGAQGSLLVYSLRDALQIAQGRLIVGLLLLHFQLDPLQGPQHCEQRKIMLGDGTPYVNEGLLVFQDPRKLEPPVEVDFGLADWPAQVLFQLLHLPIGFLTSIFIFSW